jgi:citronellol/citronellal dehydrogenase
MADAAYLVLSRPSREFTGNFCIDEEVLRGAGVTDFAPYRHPGVDESELMRDFFV